MGKVLERIERTKGPTSLRKMYLQKTFRHCSSLGIIIPTNNYSFHSASSMENLHAAFPPAHSKLQTTNLRNRIDLSKRERNEARD